MEFVSPAILALVPVIIGLVELAKQYINVRYAPLLALALGIIGSCVIQEVNAWNIIGGIVIGLSASGLYSGSKTTVQG